MNIPNGFLIVASKRVEYVVAANFCAASIKDHYPDSHITLFTPEKYKSFVDGDYFDLVTTDGVPNDVRTKLYALSKTPYTNLTVYVDADMECWHEDVQTIWNEMPEDTDVLITKIRPYNGKIAKWSNGEMIHHCGFFMYRNKEHVLKFMERWWEDYQKQVKEPWPYKEEEHPIALQPWDQFAFWKLLNIDKFPLKVSFFNDDAKWNFVNGYYNSETKNPIIFYHHTIPSKQQFVEIKK